MVIFYVNAFGCIAVFVRIKVSADGPQPLPRAGGSKFSLNFFGFAKPLSVVYGNRFFTDIVEICGDIVAA